MEIRTSGRLWKAIFIPFSAVTALFASTTTSGHYTWIAGQNNASVLVGASTVNCTPTINGTPLSNGSEIAAFDSQGHCIGSTKWKYAVTTIPVQGYDSTGGIVTPGMKPGQKFRFVIWDSVNQVEIDSVRVHFAAHGNPMPNMDSSFMVDGIGVLDSLKGFTTALHSHHFLPVPPITGNNMSVLFVTNLVTPLVNGAPITLGDEIGVFDTGNMCVGAYRWPGGNSIAVPVYGQDNFGMYKGMLPGGVMHFRAWDSSAQQEYPAVVTYSHASPATTDSIYSTDGFSVITTFIAPAVTLTQPTLAAPANGSVNQPTSLTFAWIPSNGEAISYECRVSTSSGFSTTIMDQSGITATSTATAGLADSTVYFWKVQGFASGSASAWSAVWSFTTVSGAFSAPILAAPADNAQGQPFAVSLSWGSMPGAGSYNLQTSTSPVFQTLDQIGGITGSSQLVSGLSATTTYYWRVNAVNGSVTAPWSAVWSFTTGALPPAVPVLRNPPSGYTQQLTPTLSWGAGSGGGKPDGYTVLVSTSSSFATDTTFSADSMPQITLSGLPMTTTYFWRVHATNSSGISAWSGIWSFKTISGPPPIAPKLVSPSNNLETEAFPGFSWSTNDNVPGYALGYTIQVSTSNTFTSFAQAAATGGSGLVTISTAFKPYYWRVCATNSLGMGPWSSVWNFMITPLGTHDRQISNEATFFTCNGGVNYSLPQSSVVKLTFSDIRGRVIANLDQRQAPGCYRIPLSQFRLTSGVFIVHFKAGGFERRMLLPVTGK